MIVTVNDDQHRDPPGQPEDKGRHDQGGQRDESGGKGHARRPSPLGLMGPPESDVPKANPWPSLRAIGFMALFMGVMGSAFTAVFLGAGCGDVVNNVILAMPGGPWAGFLVIQLIIFVLGMFIDWIAILFIVIPVISQTIPVLGFDPVWFALMICLNLQLSFLTPPFCPAVFLVQGMAPREFQVKSAEIIRGVLPFIVVIIFGMVICGVFPDVILWLPSIMVK